MKSFSSFNIQPQNKGFEGEKIRIDKILNKQIVVEDFKIEESKFKEKGNGKVLTLQIIVDNSKRILFSGSSTLQEMIVKVAKEDFPFTTTIIKENDRHQFT